MVCLETFPFDSVIGHSIDKTREHVLVVSQTNKQEQIVWTTMLWHGQLTHWSPARTQHIVPINTTTTPLGIVYVVSQCVAYWHHRQQHTVNVLFGSHRSNQLFPDTVCLSYYRPDLCSPLSHSIGSDISFTRQQMHRGTKRTCIC